MLKGYLIILALLPLNLLAQELIEYTPDFKFKDGLYITFEDYKNNNPIPVEYILSDYDIRDRDYLDQVLSNDSVIYFDNLYEERIIAVKDLWGFCQRSRIYIGFGADRSMNNPEFFDFYPLLNIGAISFFTAMESYYRTMSTSPSMGFGSYDPMYDTQMTVTESGQVQLLLEFRSGRILLANRGELGFVPIDLIAQLINSDGYLANEFQTLSTREQKQKSVFYLRKFNERNPIYFPLN